MISKTAAAFALAGLTAAAAIAQAPPPRSFWTSGFGQGITEYATGTFDQPVDGGVRLACLPDGTATLNVQIKGVAPAANSRFLLIPTGPGKRSQTFTFAAGADGTVRFARARTDRQLARLWTALRTGDIVTVRYGDGAFSVQSLVGARTTLPTRACR